MINQISLRINEHTEIDLPGKGSAGYEWTYISDVEGIIDIQHRYLPPEAGVAGGRGVERFTITGIKSGKCSVQFIQARSWEKDKEPLDRKAYVFTVL